LGSQGAAKRFGRFGLCAQAVADAVVLQFRAGKLNRVFIGVSKAGIEDLRPLGGNACRDLRVLVAHFDDRVHQLPLDRSDFLQLFKRKRITQAGFFFYQRADDFRMKNQFTNVIDFRIQHNFGDVCVLNQLQVSADQRPGFVDGRQRQAQQSAEQSPGDHAREHEQPGKKVLPAK